MHILIWGGRYIEWSVAEKEAIQSYSQRPHVDGLCYRRSLRRDRIGCYLDSR